MDSKCSSNKFVKASIVSIMTISPLLLIGYIIYLSRTKKLNETNENANNEEKNKRTKIRGQLISLYLMVSAVVQAIMKGYGAEENSLLLLYGFIFVGILGYLGDISYGTDEGLSSYKEGIGNGIRYMLGSLATSKFYRYIITIFLDMFISTPIQIVIAYLFKNIIDDLKNGCVGFNLFDNKKITKFIGDNFDNVLQSVIAMITFLAYTNETRFLWAYPSSTLHKDEIIPPSTIKLCTSVAAVLFLISNNSNYSDGQNTGKLMGDLLTKKIVYVLVTIILLTAGSKEFLNTLDPELEYTTEKLLHKTGPNKDKLAYIEYATKNNNLLTKNDIQQKWIKGLMIFGFLCIIGIVGPFAFTKDKKKINMSISIVFIILLMFSIMGRI